MTRTVCMALLLLMLSACDSGKLQVHEGVSDTGLAYSLVEMPGNKRVTIQVAWPSNWAFDQAGNKAVPYIASRLLLAGGTQEFPPSVVEERFADIKSEGFLMPTVEHVYGTLHYSPEHQDETLRIVNAHLQSPTLDEKWLERIRDEFSGQMNEARPKAVSKGFEAMRWAVFGSQPVREFLSLDVPDMIDEVTREDVEKWVESTIRRNGAIIAVAGDLDVKQAGLIVDSLFDGVPEGKVGKSGSVKADFSPRRIVMHDPEAEVSTLSFIGKVPPAREGGEFEDLVLSRALGGGNDSVLFEAVRTELRASYGYAAGFQGFTADNRFLMLSGQVETGKVAEAENVIRQAYARFREEGPDGDLQQLRKPFEESVNESLKDTGRMAMTAVVARIDQMPLTKILGLQDELKAVTEQSLRQRLSESFPDADEFIVVVSSPDEDALPGACVITNPEQAVDCR